MKALGSPLLFRPTTIDKPGKETAKAMIGTWMGGPQGCGRPDVALLFGLNPFQSYYGVAADSPRSGSANGFVRGWP